MRELLSEKGNQIKIEKCTIKRVISLDEVKETGYYSDMADLAKSFQHNIIETDDNVWRWRPNQLICLLMEHAPVYTPSSASAHADGEWAYTRNSREFRASINLNNLFRDLLDKTFTMEEYMKFYMQTGYSLSGFIEVFGQREAYEFGLENAKKPKEDRDEYTQTVIDYMIEKWKNKVIQL